MKKNSTYCIYTFALLFITLVAFGQNKERDYTLQTQQLASAVRSGNLEAVKKTYSNMAIQGIDPVTGLRPFHLASKLGHYDIVEFFIIREQNLESGVYVSREEMPPMVHAIKQGHKDIISLLFTKGSRHPNGGWMRKTYLFHALHMEVGQDIIDLLIKHGADMKLAQQGMPLTKEKAEDLATAEKWTTEVNAKLTLNQFDKIDIWNTNVQASNMLHQMKEKYGTESSAFQREMDEIHEWRLEQLKSIIPSHKFAQLGQLSKQ